MRAVGISLVAWVAGTVAILVAGRPLDAESLFGLALYGALFSMLPAVGGFFMILLPLFRWIRRRRDVLAPLTIGLAVGVCLLIAVVANTLPPLSSGPLSGEAIRFYLVFGLVGVVLGVGDLLSGTSSPRTDETAIVLREVAAADLSLFFEHQVNAEANHMAAFTPREPADRAAFMTRWERILGDATVRVRTILRDDFVVGHVLSYEQDGRPEISYWIGKDHWGQGIATRALRLFLAREDRRRPIYARVARDNIGSRRVLEKCGFVVTAESRGFANARGEEIDELVLELRPSPTGASLVK